MCLRLTRLSSTRTAAASMCETYLIVKNIDEAAEIASYILDEPGCLTTEALMEKYKHATSNLPEHRLEAALNAPRCGLLTGTSTR